MKRHPALVPLSLEHRRCLVVAQMLKSMPDGVEGEDLPTDSVDKKHYALEFFDHYLTPHIKAEEAILFPALRGISPKIDATIDELAAEHQQLIKCMNELEIAENLDAAMTELGHLLADHIRKEEHDLFDVVQEEGAEEQLLLLHFPHTESR
jgi:iron-sulfur cluster repair protein YtfE (RIC family)